MWGSPRRRKRCRSPSQHPPMSGVAGSSRFDWSPVLDALTSGEPGTWVSVPFSALPGDKPARNQSSLAQVAARRIGPIQTQTEGESLFVRLTTKTR